jgi:putative addiction module component (TIGR02574 family)
MPVRFEALELEQLSVGERLELIEQIWNSLPDLVDPKDVPPWHLSELAHRRGQAERNPGAGKPWQTVLDTLEEGS